MEELKFCSNWVHTADGHSVILSSGLERSGMDFRVIKYIVDVRMRTPCGPQTWGVDIRKFPLDADADPNQVCVLAVWIIGHSQQELIDQIAAQTKKRRV